MCDEVLEHIHVCVSMCDVVLLLRAPVRGSKSVKQLVLEYEMEN